jgi:hypothetical protein
MSMDDVRAFCTDKASKCGQFTQIAGNTFTDYAIADDLHSSLLQSSDLLLDERHEVTAFVRSDY